MKLHFRTWALLNDGRLIATFDTRKAAIERACDLIGAPWKIAKTWLQVRRAELTVSEVR